MFDNNPKGKAMDKWLIDNKRVFARLTTLDGIGIVFSVVFEWSEDYLSRDLNLYIAVQLLKLRFEMSAILLEQL